MPVSLCEDPAFTPRSTRKAMTHRTSFWPLALLGLWFPLIPFAQVTPETDVEVPPALRSRMDAQIAELKRPDRATLHLGLTFVRGEPILMIVTDTAEAQPKKALRLAAIVEALGFLLDETGFERANVCVVSRRSDASADQSVRNYALPRATFMAAAKRASGETNSKRALAKLKGNAPAAAEVCTELGID
jgi:hypothetical protein